MANGKGSLDCRYCMHFDHSTGDFCRFHGRNLPPPKRVQNNRICCNFEPNSNYDRDNPQPQFMPLVRRFAWFGTDLQPGVLYEFTYNQPDGIAQTAVLRVPDWQTGAWKQPE